MLPIGRAEPKPFRLYLSWVASRMPRPILIVQVTPDFEKAFLRLPTHIQALATRKDQWFRKDAFDPRLRTHKLRGELSLLGLFSQLLAAFSCLLLNEV
jgi:hypothetical protein